MIQMLEERMDKRISAIERDLKIKGKKIALLLRDLGGGDGSNSKKSLNDGKNSVDVTS